MAIDDNTTYGLTGAQVKDLAGKINGGTIKTLTVADYDYPADNPTSVAAWNLDPGIYKAGESIEVTYSTTAAIQKATLSAGDVFAVLGKDGSSNNRKTILYTKSGYLYAPTVDSSGWTYTSSTGDLQHGSVLTMDDLSNSITSGSNTRPAAQNAVKLLNNKLGGIIKTNAGAPATNTVGTVGQLIEDTTNGKLYICTDATNPYVWEEVGTGGGGLVTLSYGTSTWQDFLNAYNAGKIVYCKASSNADPSTGDQSRMAFMAYVSNPAAPTSVEFQYYRSVSTKTAAQQGDQMFVYTLNSSGTWSVVTRENSSKIAAGTGLTSTYSSGTLTINSDAPVITMTDTDPGEGAALAANNFIAVY